MLVSHVVVFIGVICAVAIGIDEHLSLPKKVAWIIVLATGIALLQKYL